MTDHDLAKSLNISMPEAKQVLAVVELQGSVEPDPYNQEVANY